VLVDRDTYAYGAFLNKSRMGRAYMYEHFERYVSTKLALSESSRTATFRQLLGLLEIRTTQFSSLNDIPSEILGGQGMNFFRKVATVALLNPYYRLEFDIDNIEVFDLPTLINIISMWVFTPSSVWSDDTLTVCFNYLINHLIGRRSEIRTAVLGVPGLFPGALAAVVGGINVSTHIMVPNSLRHVRHELPNALGLAPAGNGANRNAWYLAFLGMFGSMCGRYALCATNLGALGRDVAFSLTNSAALNAHTGERIFGVNPVDTPFSVGAYSSASLCGTLPYTNATHTKFNDFETYVAASSLAGCGLTEIRDLGSGAQSALQRLYGEMVAGRERVIGFADHANSVFVEMSKHPLACPLNDGDANQMIQPSRTALGGAARNPIPIVPLTKEASLSGAAAMWFTLEWDISRFERSSFDEELGALSFIHGINQVFRGVKGGEQLFLTSQAIPSTVTDTALGMSSGDLFMKYSQSIMFGNSHSDVILRLMHEEKRWGDYMEIAREIDSHTGSHRVAVAALQVIQNRPRDFWYSWDFTYRPEAQNFDIQAGAVNGQRMALYTTVGAEANTVRVDTLPEITAHLQLLPGGGVDPPFYANPIAMRPLIRIGAGDGLLVPGCKFGVPCLLVARDTPNTMDGMELLEKVLTGLGPDLPIGTRHPMDLRFNDPMQTVNRHQTAVATHYPYNTYCTAAAVPVTLGYHPGANAHEITPALIKGAGLVAGGAQDPVPATVLNVITGVVNGRGVLDLAGLLQQVGPPLGVNANAFVGANAAQVNYMREALRRGMGDATAGAAGIAPGIQEGHAPIVVVPISGPLAIAVYTPPSPVFI
jgi:hypothetical protein